MSWEYDRASTSDPAFHKVSLNADHKITHYNLQPRMMSPSPAINERTDDHPHRSYHS